MSEIDIVHKKVVTLPDNPAKEVSKDEWNDKHNINAGTGIVKLLSADETDVTGTGNNATAKSYTLPANVFSKILVESEVALEGVANADNEVTFEIKFGATSKESLSLRQSATGSGDYTKLAGVVKYSEAWAGGGNVTIAVTVVTGTGTWKVKSLRVYGVY